MADEGDNHPPEQEVQRADVAPQPQADNESNVEPPEPKTPTRRWWRCWRRRGEQGGKPESRFSVLTALFSAVAALAGAAVGGIASYKAAESQAAAQFRVAQANNAAQADQALISRRQTAYSDFLAAATDVDNAEYRLHDAVGDFKPPNIDPVQAAFQQFADNSGKFVHEHSNAQLVDSPEVNEWVMSIGDKQAEIFDRVQQLTRDAQYSGSVDQSALHQLDVEIDGVNAILTKFIAAARNDISGLSGH